jgi:two-component sensor histidine kinase
VTAAPQRRRLTSAAIRTRLAVILSAALAPVLLLGGLQAYLTIHSGALAQRSPLDSLWAIGLPILAFAMALVGVWIVADQTIMRWVAYLQRVAVIYAKGRYGIHPSLPAWAPTEIRDLAESLDAMAATIAARDRALRENLVHKDALLREIHHRVKNNLQVISSLLNMQQRALVDPAARAAIADTRQRISALALIYRALYEGPDLRKVDLRQFLEDLIGQLMVNDVGRRATIRTHLSIDALSIYPDQLAPLSLFAVEAITNARKHGLSDAGGGSLEVTFRVRDDEAELTISDSGRPDAPAPVVGDGVGRTLMTAFARQLAGQASFLADAGGMTVKLRFPVTLAKPEV